MSDESSPIEKRLEETLPRSHLLFNLYSDVLHIADEVTRKVGYVTGFDTALIVDGDSTYSANQHSKILRIHGHVIGLKMTKRLATFREKHFTRSQEVSIYARDLHRVPHKLLYDFTGN